MGMFEQVSEMNTAFGNPKGNPALLDAYSTEEYTAAWQRLEKQCKNILAEYQELQNALADRNLADVRDALCDINVFSLGAHHLMGIDANEDMAEVVGALYSRFCTDEAHLKATSDHYFAKGVEHYYEGEFPRKCLKSSKDQGYSMVDGQDVWEYPKGKFLKALGYRQPVFK